MFRKFSTISLSRTQAIETAAQDAYKFIQRKYRKINWINTKMSMSFNFFYALPYSEGRESRFESRRDVLQTERSFCFDDIGRYLDDIARKNDGLAVLEKIKQIAQQNIAIIKQDFKKPKSDEDVHKTAYTYAESAIHKKQHYGYLLNSIGNRG